MAFADDFTIAANGDIRHDSGSTNYTVLQMHRALQDLADDAVGSGDDIMDISVLTPSDRSTDNIVTLINGFNIDDASAVFLYDGSITQDAGATIYAGLVVVGAVVAGTNIIIIQDHGLVTDTWTSAPNADAAANILMRKVIKTRVDGANLDGQRLIVKALEFNDTYAEFSVTMALGNNVAALFTSADGNNIKTSGTVGAFTEITNTEGYQELEISGTAPAEPYYAQWTYNGGGGTPAVPVINDVYEYAKYIQRRGSAETIHGMLGYLFRGITTEWAYDTIVGVEPTDSETISWGMFLQTGAVASGPFVVGNVVTGDTSGAVGRILSVDATDLSIVVNTESGTWSGTEDITSGSTTATNASAVGQALGGGSAIVLASDTAGTDEAWVQIIRGSAPATTYITYNSLDHNRVCSVNGAPVARSVSSPFIGSSTGTALLGAFGIGLLPGDATESDLFRDLDNVSVQPPNNVTFTVSGLEIGEDRVLVGPEAGGIMDITQDTIDGALTGAAVTTVTVTTSIPTDTPAAGTIRILSNTGFYNRVPYDSYSGFVYAIPAFNFSLTDTLTADNQAVFISYIDLIAVAATATFTGVYTGADRDLFVRVRDGGTAGDLEGIKTFETTGTLGISGGSSTAIRTPDA
jgi:hypothetical protein